MGSSFLRPFETLRSQHGRLQGERRGFDRVVTCQWPDRIEPVGDCPRQQIQPGRCRVGDISALEVASRVFRSGRAPPRAWRSGSSAEYMRSTADWSQSAAEPWWLSKEDSIEQAVAAFDDGNIHFQAGGDGQTFACFLIRAGDPVCARARPPGRYPAR